LDSVTGPGKDLLFFASHTAAAFVFVCNPSSITFPNGIDFAYETKRFAGNLQASSFWCFIVQRNNLFVKSSTGVDSEVRNTDLFDFFEIE
jgi:hypothetical protein